MNRLKLLVVLLLAAVAFAANGQYRQIRSSTNATMSVVETGDTAEIIRLNQFTPNDSFTFSGDIEGYGDGAYPGLGAEDSAYTWTSPPQIARLVITSPIDTAAVYYCTLDCGTNEYGFTYDPPAIDTTLATFIDSLVDSINAVADMSDTIAAEDSTAGGYILCRSLIPQQELESGARWSIRVGASDAGTELALGDSGYTTIAMVCDSMAKTINALDSINLRLTAVNDGDTIIRVTSDKKGLAFTFDIADTSMDTTYTTLNATSKSVDTANINIGLTYGFNSMQAKFYLSEEQHAESGLGNSDSAWIILIGILAGDEYEIARDSANALPCSLITYIADDVGDTLLKPELLLRVIWTDSLTDTTFNVDYPISWDINLK